jgi:hypothetical protein
MTRSRQTADWGSRAGLAKIVPSSVAVGSGTGSANTTGTVTFSGASSVSLNDVFSTTYNNYRIVFTSTSVTSVVASNLRMRMRVGGSDNTSSNYKFAMTQFGGAYDDSVTSTSATSMMLHRYLRADGVYGNFEVYNPFATNYTGVYSTSFTPNYNVTNGCFSYASTTVTTSYTGFTLFIDNSSGELMTGTLSVLGYN